MRITIINRIITPPALALSMLSHPFYAAIVNPKCSLAVSTQQVSKILSAVHPLISEMREFRAMQDLFRNLAFNDSTPCILHPSYSIHTEGDTKRTLQYVLHQKKKKTPRTFVLDEFKRKFVVELCVRIIILLSSLKLHRRGWAVATIYDLRRATDVLGLASRGDGTDIVLMYVAHTCRTLIEI